MEIPTELIEESSSIIITKMHQCAIEPEENDQGNHWMTQLETSDNTSVRIDCYNNWKEVRSNGILAMIKIVELPRLQRKNIVRSVTLSVKKNLTLKEVLDTIQREGFDKYMKGLNGKGCRHWISCVVKRFGELGLITDPVAMDNLQDDIGKSWNINGTQSSQPVPVTVGKFLGETTSELKAEK